jgi:MATE family multidrug resistance protein
MQIISWKNHFRTILTLAVPVSLSNMGHIFVDLADNYFIGQLAERTPAQAAVSLAFGVYHFILVLLIGFSYGLTPLVATLAAQKNESKIRSHLQHAFRINLLSAIGLFVLLLICSPLLNYADRPEQVKEMASDFLHVIMLSMIPLSLFFTFKQFAEGMSDTRIAMFITIGANILNIVLNWILIFGKFGAPAMGMMGSCWATFISRSVMAIAMFVYVRYHQRYRQFCTKLIGSSWSWSTTKEQLRIGIPSGLMFTMEVAAFSWPAFFIPSTVELAAHRIALSLASMTYMVSSGLAAATTIRVGHFNGLGEVHNVRRAGQSGIIIAAFFMICAAVFFILFNTQLPSLFNSETTVVQIGAQLLLIAAAFQLFDGIQVTAQGALRGLQDTIIPGIIAFTAYWLVCLPVSYLLCIELDWGARGVWVGFVLGLLIASVGFLWRFRWKTDLQQ